MNTYKKSFLSGIFMLLLSLSFLNSTATACPLSYRSNDGSWSFKATKGSSQTKMVTIDFAGDVTVSVESGAFTVDRTIIPGPTDGSGISTFTITFTPSEGTAGTLKGSLTVSCGSCSETVNLEGTVATSGVENSGVPSDVSFTTSPNPATDHVDIVTSGVRTAEIGIYDLLGKEIATEKATNWKWNVTNIVPGCYIIRVAGESNAGEAILRSTRIIISR